MTEQEKIVYEQRWLASDERKLLQSCRLCPRACGVDRLAGKAGYCGAKEGDLALVARAAPHDWEEPSISGEVTVENGQRCGGSGTVFFSHCTLGCVYCQNRAISRPDTKLGRAVTVTELSEIFLALAAQRVNNINLVTPTQYLPQISFSLRIAREQGLALPVVYNTGGFEQVERLQALEGVVDIYLPDFKYLDPDAAAKYSGARSYPDVIFSALDEMVRQVGKPQFDGRGLLKKGVVVRHLLLPGYGNDGKRIVKLLHERYGDSIIISLMNQYTPPSEPDFAIRYPELGAPISPASYDRAVAYASRIGVTAAYIQEGGTVSESFVPDFE